MSLSVALALLVVGVLIWTIQSARHLDQAITHANQEIAEFDQLQRDGIDPDTGRPFADLNALFLLYLKRNVTNDGEALVAWSPVGRWASVEREELTKNAAVERVIESRLETGGDERVDTDLGEVLVSVQPVEHRSSGEKGALVVLTVLDQTRDDLRDLLRTYLVVALICWALITALAARQAGRLLAPVRRLSDTTRALSASDLSRRIPETGNDDITELTRTVNGMLDRLDETFSEQRVFLDAAGHELKTPLTVLRGHLELLDPDNPEDVTATRDLLIDEVDRMSRLVGDLIMLAKSARPDFVVPEPVDLQALLSTVLTKAAALGDRDWTDDRSPELVVPLDEQRITQALLQLADNAVKHTNSGDVIGLGAERIAGQVRLWVRDTGAGVPEKDHQRIFERFGRSHVPRNDEGFGLGLSIVRAIAEAHGGTAHVEPEEPQGARFVITLPSPEETTWPAS